MRTIIHGSLGLLSVIVSCNVAAATPAAKHGRPGPTAQADVQYYPRAGKPFSSAVRIGRNVYISGVVGTAADGTMPTDFTTQATNTMDAVASNMKIAGASMDDVYKCTIVLTNMANWSSFNTVYLKYFKADRFPVRMSFASPDLRNADVEVQCEAYIGK
jgi:2-iminobutanoate/2-iminopropanoate deaminase